MSHQFKGFDLMGTLSNALFDHLAIILPMEIMDMELDKESAMAYDMEPEMEPKKERKYSENDDIKMRWNFSDRK